MIDDYYQFEFNWELKQRELSDAVERLQYFGVFARAGQELRLMSPIPVDDAAVVAAQEADQYALVEVFQQDQ